ncbi:MAG: hypothetical protein M3019_06725 [Candidatus Dormibacteraeota bacterium]|nr:hypothetical protein [Candidatus Dormibacteraeota bacterium]
MTEVIVRELRLRGYEDVQYIIPAPHVPPADGVAAGALPPRETSPSETLVRRHSRQRDHDVTLDL